MLEHESTEHRNTSKKNHNANWAFLCSNFTAKQDKELYSDPFINKIGISWHLKEARVIVRRDYRNNLNNIQNGTCFSYGAITGEDSAISFTISGKIELSNGNKVLIYSDGFTKFLYDNEFISQIIHFDKNKFENYIKMKSQNDYDKYGKEKTFVLSTLKVVICLHWLSIQSFSDIDL